MRKALASICDRIARAAADARDKLDPMVVPAAPPIPPAEDMIEAPLTDDGPAEFPPSDGVLRLFQE